MASELQTIEVENPREVLRREEEAVVGLKAALTLVEETKKKMKEEIGAKREWVIDDFKSSKAMEDIKIAFAREAFLEGF